MPECIQCQKPLGADSVNLGYTLCHPCRKCSVCGMTLSPKDVEFCQSLGLDKVKHPRCITLSDRELPSQPDKWLKVMNWCSTMSNTETIIKDMSFDDRYLYMQSVMAHAMNLSIALKRDKAHYEQKMREEEQAEKRAKSTPKPDPIKKAAQVLGVKTTSEKVARKKLSDREKAILAIMPFMPTREAAEAAVDSRIKAQQVN